MADFYQNGLITTLHNLTQRSSPSLERELLSFSRQRPLGLVLPSLFSELEGEALTHIIQTLSEVNYLNHIVIGLDRADQQQYRYALNFFDHLPQQHDVLWNDGPRLQALDAMLEAKGLAPKEMGKGRNVWYCLGYMLAKNQADAIALHDCDITTYDRQLLARLIYPVANPDFNYAFCKGYYPRWAEGKLNGRVTRLLVTPLLMTLKKVLGENDYLDYLNAFRYPLAGEFSFRRDVLLDLRIPSDWGLEIGVLSEMNRNYANNRICQVDISDAYDHKHQPLSLEDANQGLSKMSVDISKAIFRKLATNGVIFQQETFRTIKATYYRSALDFIDSYRNDARINGLSFDAHREEKAVELFAHNIMEAGQLFLNQPEEVPFIPSWSRVRSAIPNIFELLLEAVAADQHQFRESIDVALNS